MADEKAPEEQAEEKSPRRSLLQNPMILLTAVVLFQAGMAFAAVHFWIRPLVASAAGVEEAVDEQADGPRPRGTLVPMDEMVVSLSSPGRPRYLRTSMVLEAADQKVAKSIEERMPEFRDTAILKLSSFSPEDVASFEGKEAVKAEIKTALKGILDEGTLLNVYFTDFVIQ